MNIAMQLEGIMSSIQTNEAIRTKTFATRPNSLLMQHRHEVIYELMRDGKHRVPRELAQRFKTSERTIRNHFNRMGCVQTKVGEVTWYALPV